MFYIRYALYLVVLIESSLALAGSYDDFFVALRQDNAYELRRVLQRGFDPNSVGLNSQPALIQALKVDAFKVAEVLMAHPETDINVRSDKGETPLMLAAIKGQIALCRQLLAREADVNKPGWAPLHYAASAGHTDIVTLLLEHFAYIDAEAPNGSTPLMMAARYGTSDAVKALLAAGADPALRNAQGLTALDLARRNDNSNTVAPLQEALGHSKSEGNW